MTETNYEHLVSAGERVIAESDIVDGNWEIRESIDADGNRGLYIYDGEDVCNLYTYRRDEHGISRELVPFPHAEANARLIAAAPDMLEALRMVRKHGSSDASVCRFVDEVICKATFGS